MNYYTSDLHFYHERIISLCRRPFENVGEMNERIVSNFNKVLSKDDLLFILGDIAACKQNPIKQLRQIPGKKVLIVGNHDKSLLKNKEFLHCFVDITKSEIVKDGEYKIYLNHYPMAEWDGYFKGIYHFYGHIHNSELGAGALMNAFYPKAINVGVDVNGFVPRTAKELILEREESFSYPDGLNSELYSKMLNHE